MNITKEIAINIANKLVALVEAKIVEKTAELNSLATAIWYKYIPERTLELLDQLVSINKDYLYFSSYINFNCIENDKYNTIGVSLKQSVCSKRNDNYLTVTNKEFKDLKVIEKEILTLKEKKKQFTNQLINHLLKLRTFKRVREDFPEAAIYLPSENPQMVPAIDLKKVLNEINNI